MNKRHYKARATFWAQLNIVLFGVLFACMGHFLTAFALIFFVAGLFNCGAGRLNAVTLSVPEILMDVLDAFKLETPELFGPNGFATDFSSKTAVLGDKVTAKIAKVPIVGDYDRANGGFKAASQDVTGLIEDVPVTLNQFKVVTVNVTWLTQLASKIPLYKEAVRNYGYVLGKYVVDTALATITAANFTNSVKCATQNINLDTFDGDLRNQLNSQKTFNKGRFAIISSDAAKSLGADDRVRSSLFYGMLNGDQGYRIWRNIAGFSWIREYPDFPTAGNLWGYAGDYRGIAVATRRPDFSNVAEQLGVPKVQDFYPLEDPESGVFMTGTSWQEVGTGDVYVACGILFGTGAGAQGGVAGTITDKAGVRLITS
jgi:hypothetical protein